MTHPDPYRLIVSSLVEHLGLDETTILPTLTFQELDVDSLALVEVALLIQECVDVDLEESVDLYTTVGETADLLRSALAELPAQAVTPAEAEVQAVL
ncbi:acyl carrier protein [Streptomyces xanthophaeus]|uniref:acyl carrier protein n=1 Tax=Streptomyces xanthophaeus TaxID=67385 RepID=UPI00068C98C5|nr:phosphopantetheine-binding protein [Streptomyces xanthophaeus]